MNNMKKLMIAASAALCAAVGFSDITSSNIVGYQNVGADCSGQWQRGATFNTIGLDLDGYSIQSIIPQKPANAENDLEDDAANIQVIDEYGEPVETYSYYVGGEGSAVDKAGWYVVNGSVLTYSDRKFARGEAFIYVAPYFYNESTGDDDMASDFTSSGEVSMGPVTVMCDCSGQWQRHNYRPVDLSIQKLIPVPNADAENELADDAANITTINEYGEPVETFSYLVGGDGSAADEAGWYLISGSTITKSDKVFAPGEGFIYVAPYFYNEATGADDMPSGLNFAE